jgi:MFS family permease
MPISASSVYVTTSCLVPNSAGEITGSRAARSTGISAAKAISATATAASVSVLEGALFFVPAALVAAQHLSYALAGIVAAVGAVVFVAVIPLAGRALDLYGSRIVLMAGAVCTAAGLALLGGTLASLPLALLSMVVAGVGFGALLGAPTRYIITREVPANMRATAVWDSSASFSLSARSSAVRLPVGSSEPASPTLRRTARSI